LPDRCAYQPLLNTHHVSGDAQTMSSECGCYRISVEREVL
jgi:hypothetical protein